MHKATMFLLTSATTLTLAGCGAMNPATATPTPTNTPVAMMTSTPAMSADPSTAATPTAVAMTYTLADVAQHATPEDCWMAISGKVYNATGSIGKHPGGEVILQGCGKDATQLFFNRPGEGTPHSEKTQKTIEKLYIGDLK